MKVIDAHIHYWVGQPHFDSLAKEAGHENSEDHLREVFKAVNIERAVVMSNLRLEPGIGTFPDFLNYCAGIGHESLDADKHSQSIELAETHLRRDDCVGLKIYAGYTHYYLDNPLYTPFYELARQYKKPVAVHMGVTAHARALLKYCHPLQMDDVAVAFPDVQFVMCHFGNPWLMDASAVLEKNDNVVTDLSGLIVGKFAVEDYISAHSGYVEQLKTWIDYVDNYDKFMFGTDFPLTDFGEYIRLFEQIIPEAHHDSFFYKNAKRIYSL